MMKKLVNLIIVLAIIMECYPLNPSSAKTVIYPTVASGEKVASNATCLIDYSNCKDGYVVVKYKKSTKKVLKVQTIANGKEDRTYTYTIKPKKKEVIPLTEGNGTYKINVYLNLSGNEYVTVLSETIMVNLTDEFAPYIRPNQYVNYKKSTKVVKKAATLTKKSKNDLAKVRKIYNYVVKTYRYDKKLARTVKSGYLPNLNKIYKKKKGICFDYAAVMTAMLRSQGVPTKLVIGYAGNEYHAWINVYSKKKGWITGAIYINCNTKSGKVKWKLMDPTFASTSNSSKSVMKKIESGKIYKAKYSY